MRFPGYRSVLPSCKIVDAASESLSDPEDVSQRRISDLSVRHLFDGFIGNGRPVGQDFERPVML